MKRKFNIIDALLILVILAAVAVCLLFLRSRGTIASSGAAEQMSYTVEIKEAPRGMIDCVETAGVGSKVYRSTDSTYLGTLTAFRYEPTERVEYSPALGKYVQYADEEYFSLYLDITGDGAETASDISVSGNPAKVGQEIFVKGKGYAGRSFVVGVNGSENPVENTNVAIGDRTVQYTACVKDIRDFTANSLHEGDHLYDSTTGADLGAITAVELTPFCETRLDAQGNVVTVEKPGRYCAALTLDARCTETENSYFLDGKFELKIGASSKCKTKYVECEFAFTGLLAADAAIGG